MKKIEEELGRTRDKKNEVELGRSKKYKEKEYNEEIIFPPQTVMFYV